MIRENRSLIASIGFFRSLSALAAAALVFATAPAKAAVTYSGSGLANSNSAGETNTATATFDLSIAGTTTNFVVTLSNTAAYIPNDNPDILTGVFFTLAGNPTLTRISGVLNAGSVAMENGTNLTIAGVVVGGSWTYKAGLSTAPGGANQGISSAGFNIFGPPGVFPGAALPDDSPVPDGIGGGLTTTVDGGTSDGLSGRPFIQYSAVFTLGAVPASFTLSDISDVSFQYGTALDEAIRREHWFLSRPVWR
jgi:hypothetical protein